MYKELIISIGIIIAILGLNKITQNNTNNTVEQLSQKLETLRQEVVQEDINYEKAEAQAQEVYDTWEELDDTMAYYIEHNEIEKISTELTSVKSYVEIQDYEHIIEDIDKCIYLLEHINDREKLKLDNIF